MPWYDDWSTNYAAVFGLAMSKDGEPTADALMLAAWEPVFVACGYVRADLEAATLAIARSERLPVYRRDHLAAIHGAVRGRRQAAERRREPDPSEIGECADCGNAGTVTVPHPEYVKDGQWKSHWSGYRPTAAVLCHCWAGRRWLEGYHRRPAEYRERIKPAMAFADYSSRVPQWRQLLAARAAEEDASHAATWATDQADKAGPLAAVMKRLAAAAASKGTATVLPAPPPLKVFDADPAAAAGEPIPF